MKRIASFLISLMLALMYLPAHAAQLSVTAPDVNSAQVPSVTVNWLESKGYYILAASWKEGNDDWEICVTGLPEKLSSRQIELLVSAVRQGKTAVLSGSGLIDAEKATNKLPLSYGEKLYTDEISDEGNWGDSRHCWAASVSDMLTLTGWIDYAAETDTGQTFTDEDDLFGFFNRAFINDGSHHIAALNWVFTGKDSWELAIPRENITGPMIQQYAEQVAMLDLRADECSSLDDYMALLCERLPLLKQGAALGSSISLCPIDYPLKSDPDLHVSYDSQLSSFVLYEIVSVPWIDVEETLFVPDAQTGMPIPVEQNPDGSYAEVSSGAPVSKEEVLIGDLVYDDEQKLWFSIDPNCYYSDNDPFYIRQVMYTGDETDLTQPEYSPILTGGEHAVTVMGYAMNLSEADPARRIKAVILSDSDNDAAIFRPDDSTLRREDRPDTYTMYPTEIISTKQGDTISLLGYLPYTQTLLYSLTSLMPAPDVNPDSPPETGDSFPIAPCAAVLLLMGIASLWAGGRRNALRQSRH